MMSACLPAFIVNEMGPEDGDKAAREEDEPAEEAIELIDLSPSSNASTFSFLAAELILPVSSSAAGDQYLASRSQLSARATRGFRYS